MPIRGSTCGSGYTWQPRLLFGVDPGITTTTEDCAEDGPSCELNRPPSSRLDGRRGGAPWGNEARSGSRARKRATCPDRVSVPGATAECRRALCGQDSPGLHEAAVSRAC